MWIHELGKSAKGDAVAIGAQARAAGIKTVTMKAAHGDKRFGSQFSPANVAALKAQGLRVCAYQRLQGTNPNGQAQRALEAIRAGADCFVIDAESELEGKYRVSQTYMRALRAGAGNDYPIGFTGFPYVQFHPRFPYSVFLGSGGATFNAPQVYWKAIGTSPEKAMAITYRDNSVYGRDIYPLGQSYSRPGASAMKRFRKLSARYGAKGVSWWVWQHSGKPEFSAIGAPLSGGAPIQHTWPVLKSGARGDLVIWAQQHLIGAQLLAKADGRLGSTTQRALVAFQERHGLFSTGILDPATWPVLLREHTPADVTWPAGGGPARPARSAR